MTILYYETMYAKRLSVQFINFVHLTKLLFFAGHMECSYGKLWLMGISHWMTLQSRTLSMLPKTKFYITQGNINFYTHAVIKFPLAIYIQCINHKLDIGHGSHCQCGDSNCNWLVMYNSAPKLHSCRLVYSITTVFEYFSGHQTVLILFMTSCLNA